MMNPTPKTISPDTLVGVYAGVAGAAELVKGKSAGVPVAIIRGLDRLVGDLDLPGARTIVRPADRDLFRQGAEEAYDEGYRAGFDEAQAEGPLRTE